jgi:hypothetical protein
MEDLNKFVLKGKFSNLIMVNIIGGVLGIIIIFFISRVPHYGPIFFVFGIIFIAIWMFGDAIVWRKRGVHELHINRNGILVIRGASRKEFFIKPEQITDIHVHRRMNRVSLNIMLEQKVQSIPGIITLYPGKRVQLTSDAYDDKQFEAALALLEKYFKK